MQIPKDMVVEQLRARGDIDSAERADKELAEKVDPEQDAGILQDLGIEPGELIETFNRQSPGVG